MDAKKLILGAVSLASIATQADVKLPQLFNNDMVIQRDTNAPVWGWADAGEKVNVKASWGSEATATAGEDGKWMVKLATPKAGGPHTITFTGNNTIELNNVLSGDVWLCSGQSNMEWLLQNSVKGDHTDITAANFPEIRHFKANHTPHKTPSKDNQGYWKVCSPKTVGQFTAVGYYFGREIYKSQNVPVGLLSINWGGTRIEPWTPPVGFHMVPELGDLALKVDEVDPLTKRGNAAYKQYVEQMKKWVITSEKALSENEGLPQHPNRPTLGESHQSPTYLYNGMIHPIVPAAIKGAIWYQGEANGNEGVTYFHKMQALINGWRKVFKQDNLPFYYVQLANLGRSNPDYAPGGDGWARLRQAQLDSLQIKNTGMALAVDIGEAKDIHPRNKQDVGIRLAQWALNKTYDEDVVPSGPLYKAMKVEGNKAIISFDYVGGGLMAADKVGKAFPKETSGAKLKWFSICDSNKQWHKADAVIAGDTVVVSSPDVKQPTAVRYAYAMNPAGLNLYNKEGLPASPFTTD